MKKVVVIASENPVKVKVAEKAFAAVFPKDTFQFIKVKSESGVPDQPVDEQTIQGARNRLKFIKKKHPKADYWISQEGGVFREDKRLFTRAWIMVCDKSGFIGEASAAHFYLPKKVVKYLNEGMELGDATDKFFSTVNSKHGLGAVGYLTDGLIDRAAYYLQPAILALSEVKHKDWYK